MSNTYIDTDRDFKKQPLLSDDDSEGEIFQKDGIEQLGDEDWPDASVTKITCKQNCIDCSNVFKAFIGSAIIGLPFAVHQAGIILSIIGILLIAIITDHCCSLIVRCKRIVIANIMAEREAQGIDKESRDEEELHLGKTLSFGRIGKACMGKTGLLAVNISIMVTQFGFTSGYFIFMGNTLRSVFKHFLVNPTQFDNITTPVPTSNTSYLDARSTVLPITTVMPTNLSLIVNGSSTVGPSSVVNLTTATDTVNFLIHEVNSTRTLHFLHHHLSQLKNPLSDHNLLQNTSTTFALLTLIPLPILIMISFVRNLRKLGPISVIANNSIVVAWLATVIFMLVTKIAVNGWPSDIAMFKFSTFPVFFGQVTGAFEGIGTVIPVEGSMAENRRKYPCFLHIALASMSVLLGSFGIIGYISYSDKTCQIITQNLHGDIAIALQLLLFVGVLFTYPMQIFPNVQITEHLYLKFKRWRASRVKKHEITSSSKPSDSGEDEALLEGNERRWMGVSAIKVKTWEGNVIRVFLVLFTAAFALVFRAQFAYIAALTGSIGSSLLSYILPPLFYLSLMKNRGMSRGVWLKNWCLIIFGVGLGIMGLTITLKEIIASFGSNHQQHC